MRSTIRHVAVLAAAVVMLTAIAVPAQGAGGDKDECRVKNLRTKVEIDNLQSQINAAAYGDTLKIRGVCVGNFTITGRVLTLLGKERAGVPVATLDANGSARPLWIEDATVTLTDLMITGGSVGGIGIFSVSTVSTVTLNGSTRVSGNEGFWMGGGIYTSWSNLTLNDSVRVSGNTGAAFGGGIYKTGGTLTLNDSVRVSGNEANQHGGGIYNTGANASMTGSLPLGVFGNTADADDDGIGVGGGIYGCVSGAVAGIPYANVYQNYRGTISPVLDNIANGCS